MSKGEEVGLCGHYGVCVNSLLEGEERKKVQLVPVYGYCQNTRNRFNYLEMMYPDGIPYSRH